MKVAVCELPDNRREFDAAWQRLVAHVQHEHPDLVLLPELPFAAWFATSRSVDLRRWADAVRAHDVWVARLEELAPAAVLATRPVPAGTRRLNAAFVWEHDGGLRDVRAKRYLPDEDGAWEASWFTRGDDAFPVVEVAAVRVGFQICTELWFLERAREYGRRGAHVIAVPRLTEASTLTRWLIGGQAAAIVSGSYVISSNRSGANSAARFGGQGWIVDPDGKVVGLTSAEQPVFTAELDLDDAELAKSTYPRTVAE